MCKLLSDSRLNRRENGNFGARKKKGKKSGEKVRNSVVKGDRGEDKILRGKR